MFIDVSEIPIDPITRAGRQKSLDLPKTQTWLKIKQTKGITILERDTVCEYVWVWVWSTATFFVTPLDTYFPSTRKCIENTC